MFRALKPVIGIWLGVTLYGCTSNDWSMAAGGAALALSFFAAYLFGHAKDPQRRW